MAKKILRLPAVKTKTGLSRSTIYARILQGTFPLALTLGPNTVGWLEADPALRHARSRSTGFGLAFAP